MNLFIRVDSDGKIGAGHIMRCIALAQAWQDHGGEVTFISHCESEALRERISKEGFQFIAVKAPHPHSDDLSITLEYLKRPSAFTLHPSPTWLVLDGYHFTTEYQKTIRDGGIRLLVIDDMNHLPHYHADILLNQNIHAPELTYHCDENTTLLLGTQYALLRREFLKHSNFQRHIPERAKNILVTLGGADPDNVTLKVIEALKLLDDPGIEVKIIVGPVNPHKNILLQSLSSTRSACELLINPPNMPELMAWADMAISAGGSTCWELALMAVPGLLFILSENQEPIAVYFNKSKAAQNLGWHSRYNFNELSDLIFSLILDFKARKAMSDNNKDLIDGMGSLRMYKCMMEDHA
ncbi:MAG: UDP-2,4-diacetamido-2,4,6-trideoxy-beta-L-altropyranose hydrolase [Porphyromonadaceae bacterium]|nr:MAG: UDP-2,4-diacetamido-2,4,6-trideoxy-beta-L-altropyranose hydrolase [Porphyromonadaceae bacterium]